MILASSIILKGLLPFEAETHRIRVSVSVVRRPSNENEMCDISIIHTGDLRQRSTFTSKSSFPVESPIQMRIHHFVPENAKNCSVHPLPADATP